MPSPTTVKRGGTVLSQIDPRLYKIEADLIAQETRYAHRIKVMTIMSAFVITMASIYAGWSLSMNGHEQAGIAAIVSGAGLITASALAKKIAVLLKIT